MPTSWVALYIALWVVVVVLIILVLGLSRRIGQVESLLEAVPMRAADLLSGGPAIGSQLPAVSGFEELLSSAGSSSGQVVLFLSSTCAPCLRLGEQLSVSSDDNEPSLNFNGVEMVVVTDEAGRSIYADTGAARVITEHDGESSRRLGVSAFPFGIAVDQAGIVRAVSLPSTLDDVTSLAEACRQSDRAGASSERSPGL